MGKAKFLIVLVGIALLGIPAYAAVQDECSYAPGGSFDLRLVPEGIAHFFDEEADCNPWAVVEPDQAVSSVTIIPSSSWTDAPSRAVTINADGNITISEPLGRDGEATRPLVTATDRALAESLLSDLRRFTRFNRLPLEDLDEFVERLPEGADLFDSRTYTVLPETRCWGQLYDGGSIRLQYIDGQGRERTSILDSFCHSPAMTSAIKTAWDARERVFERTGFTGEHYVDELATF